MSLPLFLAADHLRKMIKPQQGSGRILDSLKLVTRALAKAQQSGSGRMKINRRRRRRIRKRRV